MLALAGFLCHTAEMKKQKHKPTPTPSRYSVLRQLCNLFPLLKVPDTVEVSMRQKDDTRIYFLLNHQNSPVRIQFYKPMHDFLTGSTLQGNYDLPPHGVLVLDERVPHKTEPEAES